MIGPANRVAGAHTQQIEMALAFTAPGQATWADPSIPHTCGDCAHFVEVTGGRKNMGRCREHGAHARPPRGTARKTAAGVRGVRARRKGGGAMRERDSEARLERVKPNLKILKGVAP